MWDVRTEIDAASRVRAASLLRDDAGSVSAALEWLEEARRSGTARFAFAEGRLQAVALGGSAVDALGVRAGAPSALVEALIAATGSSAVAWRSTPLWTACRRAGWQRICEELVVVRELEPAPPSVTFGTRALRSEAQAADLLAQSASGSKNRRAKSVEELWSACRGPERWPHWWALTHTEEAKPIGLALPRIEPGRPEQGRLQFFGLVAAMRGRGWASAAHRAVLAGLAQLGARQYQDATDVHNTAMQRVFSNNGCTPLGIRTEWMRPGTSVDHA